ncbi:hypothetical protein OBBRIDRAFT_312852 [Obba rivulosa]|uniref:Uncharacterized protein n=1 Tax=Obba rivulosa TaxID=1052685 RepID=A0A8E2AJ47_9APHY|nr:hypothetical protein OBBRIDRAFT_312852 [Obba rivulosa]
MPRVSSAMNNDLRLLHGGRYEDRPCSNAQTPELMTLDNLQSLLTNNPGFQHALADAWGHDEFAAIRSLAPFRPKEEHVTEPESYKTTVQDSLTQGDEIPMIDKPGLAWSSRYAGTLHESLHAKTNSAFSSEEPFPSLAAIIQSTGTGKSRDQESAGLDFYTPTQNMVLANVPLAFTFEPGRAARDQLQKTVASHMRMLYSVPRHWNYFRSAYSSEPLLADAAYREAATSGESPLSNILADALRNDLCNLGGEVVWRALLTLAYDRAVERDQHISSLPTIASGEVVYSKSCSIVTFIEELFSVEHAQKILDRCANNITRVLFREAFRFARLRFTHFARLGDIRGITPPAPFVDFLRGHAQMCHTMQNRIDMAIPILLHVSDLGVEKTSSILVSFQRRLVPGTLVKYENNTDTLQIFEPWAGHMLHW